MGKPLVSRHVGARGVLILRNGGLTLWSKLAVSLSWVSVLGVLRHIVEGEGEPRLALNSTPKKDIKDP